MLTVQQIYSTMPEVENSTFKKETTMLERFETFSLAISEISKHWHKLTTDEMGKYGLKGPHSIYLLVMAKHDEGLTAPQICELCGKDKADVSRTMSVMEQKGLVKKEGSSHSLYRGLLKLTEDGKKAAQYVSDRARLAVEMAGKGLSEENRKIFYDALGIIATNMRELSRNGLPE